MGTTGYGSDWSTIQIHLDESSDGLHPTYRLVTLSGIRITGGTARDGAGLAVTGWVNLAINDCDISDNHCGRPDGTGNTEGGGIYAEGEATELLFLDVYGPNISIANSTIDENSTNVNDDSSFVGTDLGGGIYSDFGASLTVADSQVTDNLGENGAGGVYFVGGIFNETVAPPDQRPLFSTFFRVSGSIFVGNSALSKTNNDSGGAIVIAGSTGAMLSDTTFAGNEAGASGGAIELANVYTGYIGQFNVVRCTFEDNVAAQEDEDGDKHYYGSGGALDDDSYANKVFIVNSTFSDNSTQIGNGGAIAITPQTFLYFHEAMFIKNYNNDQLILNPDQSGDPDGSPYYPGTSYLEVDNSTIAENSAAGMNDDDVIYQGGRGGGIAVLVTTAVPDPNVFVSVSSTIIAKNTATLYGPDSWARDDGDPLDAVVLSGGYNLIGVAAGDGPNESGKCYITPALDGVGNPLQGTTTSPLDPGFTAAGLAFNGGLVKTYALRWNSPTDHSPAIDEGVNIDSPYALIYDERDYPMLRDVKLLDDPGISTSVDIGAYELQAPMVISATTYAVSAVEGSSATVVQPSKSRVNEIIIVFNEPVQFAGNDPYAAISLTRTGTSTTTLGDVSPTITVDPLGDVVTLTFSANAFTDPSDTTYHSLIDGYYKLTINASKTTFSGIQLAGNNVDIGSDYDSDDASFPERKIWRLFGDTTGDTYGSPPDANSDAADFLAFRLAFLTNSGSGSSPNNGFQSGLDVDGDGDIDAADFTAFRLHFLQTP